MAITFRNSLFGFNKDDVHQFVLSAKENEYKYENKVKELEKQLSSLNSDIEILSTKITSLIGELNIANEKVKDYEQREEALTRLSESIGRLYLVAQSNAQAIAVAAKENIEISENAVRLNLEATAEAESNILEIEQELNERVAEFNSDVAELRNRLSLAKDKISENAALIQSSEEKLDSMTAEITSK